MGLVLTRGPTQTVVFHHPKTLEVYGRVVYVSVSGTYCKSTKVRLGFDFPESIAINREEIYNAMLKEKQEAEERAKATRQLCSEETKPYFDGQTIRKLTASNVAIKHKVSKLNKGSL